MDGGNVLILGAPDSRALENTQHPSRPYPVPLYLGSPEAPGRPAGKRVQSRTTSGEHEQHSSEGPSGTGRVQSGPNAQKRFRARQKERMSCLEREFAEKKAEYEHLAAENVQLLARTNILEK
ncbi:hypothetical protein TSOC_007694, partial [Tetrabaena socialis]